MADYAASLSNDGLLTCSWSSIYQFGTGSYSFGAWVQAQGTEGGTLISTFSPAPSSAYIAGWLVTILPAGDGGVSFLRESQGSYEIATIDATILDGCWHHVAAVYDSSNLGMTIYVDGQPYEVTWSWNQDGPGVLPLNVSNLADLYFGSAGDWNKQYADLNGLLNEVTLWNVALTAEQVAQLLTCSIDTSAPSLIGYWTLNNTLDDSSSIGNGATTSGTVPFVQTFDADLCYGPSKYCLTAMINDGSGASSVVTRAQQFLVYPETPMLLASVTSDFLSLDVPANLTVSLVAVEEPDTYSFGKEKLNTDSAYVGVSNETAWMFVILNPIPGPWEIGIEAPGNVAFALSVQAIPNNDLSTAMQSALEPVYGTRVADTDVSFLSVWGWVAVGAAAIAGAVFIVATVGTGAPAVATALLAIGGAGTFGAAGYHVVRAATDYLKAQKNYPQNVPQAAANMAGLNPSPTPWPVFLLVDTAYDDATKALLQQRRDQFYGLLLTEQVTCIFLQEVDANSSMVIGTLAQQSPNVTYCSASSHGRPTYLTGYMDQSRILEVGKIEPAVANIIFHFLACNTGKECGPAIVKAGGAAFVGYKERFIYVIEAGKRMLEPDIQFDLEMMTKGRTVGEALEAMVDKYQDVIADYRQNGYITRAADLQTDLDRLVGPNYPVGITGYGDPAAKARK